MFGCGSEEMDDGVAGPEAEALDFVEGFEMGHADFQDGVSAVGALGGSNEGGADVGSVEGITELYGPLFLERFDDLGKTLEPSRPFRRIAAVRSEGGGDFAGHREIVTRFADERL